MSGVPITIPALPTITPVGQDAFAIWDDSAGITGKINVNALTAIYDAKYAQLAITNTFTASQAFNISIALAAFDNGTSVGPAIRLNQNNNATTPAPGSINFVKPDGGNASVYTTSDGFLRVIASFNVTNANMASGTVVGTQTSSLAEKDVTGAAAAIEDILAFIAEGAAAVRRFQYKPPLNWDTGEREGERPFNGDEFSGVIIDYSPRYGMDRDAEHPEGKSLNTVNATGDLMLAVNWLVGRVQELESRLQTAVDAIEAALTNFEGPPA